MANSSEPTRTGQPATGGRRRKVILWLLAILITITAGVYQRLIGPTRPIRGSAEVAGELVRYRFDRTASNDRDHVVRLELPPALLEEDAGLEGRLHVRRYPTDDPWTTKTMVREGDALIATLPSQPPGGKVAYHLELHDASRPAAASITLPAGEEAVVLRYRGPVPAWLVLAHVLFIFMAMLWSNRAGLEALVSGGDPRRHTTGAVTFLFLGGMIFGPLMQWYAFGEFWTGFPLGYDLTDNKTLIAVVAWVLAFFLGRSAVERARTWAIIAALVTLIIFSIPHSVLGTELDHSEMDPSAWPVTTEPAPGVSAPGEPVSGTQAPGEPTTGRR